MLVQLQKKATNLSQPDQVKPEGFQCMYLTHPKQAAMSVGQASSVAFEKQYSSFMFKDIYIYFPT